MESSLRCENFEPWFRFSYLEQTVNYDRVLYDQVDNTFFTVIPDLNSEIEKPNNFPDLIMDATYRIRKNSQPYYLEGEEVDAILRTMFNFEVFDQLESAESQAINLSEEMQEDFIPAYVESGNPFSILYSGPDSCLFFD